MDHPTQPLEKDEHGVLRFKRNTIVAYIIDWCASKNGTVGYPEVKGPAPSLNEIAAMDFPRECRVQLAQLIGYSLAGFDELNYVTDADHDAAIAPVVEERGLIEAILTGGAPYDSSGRYAEALVELRALREKAAWNREQDERWCKALLLIDPKDSTTALNAYLKLRDEAGISVSALSPKAPRP